MLEYVQSLPRSKSHATGNDGNRQARLRQRRPDMRRHVVRSLRRMPEIFAFFRDELFKEVTHIQRHIRICVLLNDQRTGSVLNESRQKTIGDALFA